MFHLMNPRFQCFERIIFFNWDNFLREYGTRIHAFVGNEMHHDARM